MSINLFAQIKKVDEAKRLVFGRLAHEAVDKADEIMDYASSKPHFQKWSEDIAKDTDGASLGNLRAMHGKVAAGKFVQIDFNDAEKAIDVCAKVVDDNEWKKVLEGVYTGFSIGGSYVGEKKVEKADGRDVTRYTARPTEGSLVDRPCIPSAKFFEVQKADGSLAKVDFQEAEPEPVDVVGTDEEVLEFGKLLNENGLSMGDVLKGFPAFMKDKEKKGKEGSKEEEATESDDEKKAEAKKAEEAEKLAKAADLASDESLEKLEASLADALAKIGARNNKADAARIAKIHDMAVELGHQCAPAEKVEKLDVPDLQKMVADAVAPLQKQLGEQAATIEKLSKSPAPTRVALRAVSKAQDVGGDAPTLEDAVAEMSAPLVDDRGDKHEAAGLIKMLHKIGGTPVAMPGALRK